MRKDKHRIMNYCEDDAAIHVLKMIFSKLQMENPHSSAGKAA